MSNIIPNFYRKNVKFDLFLLPYGLFLGLKLLKRLIQAFKLSNYAYSGQFTIIGKNFISEIHFEKSTNICSKYSKGLKGQNLKFFVRNSNSSFLILTCFYMN